MWQIERLSVTVRTEKRLRNYAESEALALLVHPHLALRALENRLRVAFVLFAPAPKFPVEAERTVEVLRARCPRNVHTHHVKPELALLALNKLVAFVVVAACAPDAVSVTCFFVFVVCRLRSLHFVLVLARRRRNR